MSEPGPRVVFDCNIFVQALLNGRGPAGACVQAACDRAVELFISPFILDELRDAPNKPTPARFGLDAGRVERLIVLLLGASVLVTDVPHVFDHPIDPDDSPYINLAIATGSRLIVSRDRHLLELRDQKKPWSSDFRARFPDLLIAGPEDLLKMLRSGQP